MGAPKGNMNNRNSPNQWTAETAPSTEFKWKPGEYGGYSNWLKTLTPEEYSLHMKKRAQKRTMKAAMKAAQEAMQEEWISSLDKAAASVLNKAIQTGDAQALQVVWDRYVGKPSTEVDMTVENRQQNLEEIMSRVKRIADQGDNNGDI
jgi:hypothetical protein